MASSSRQTSLFGINDWKRIYQTYNTADFKAYDYETLRKSFLDYLRLNYPEQFTDFTESSEFVALLDIMAFLGQGLSFRNDLNAREGFLDTAERRDSVLKLANLVSYTAKRNLAAEGYLKITAISTTEDITDINGFNLANQTILWNDPANINWLEQFNTIFNAALVSSQRIGRPANTADILGVITNEYTLNIPTGTLPAYSVNSVVDNMPMNFELVSVSSVGSDTLYEIPPEPTNRFNFLYRTDRRGYGSANTGYFFYFKQGQLQAFDFNLIQQISNQTIPIGAIEGINNTDTWLWQINSDNTLTYWDQVESVYTGISQRETVSQRKIFSVISGFNDTVSYVFGDGVFSEIPVGNYRAYVRAGNGLTYQIEPTEMQGVSATINYISRIGKPETLSFTLALQQSVNNAQQRENINEIKLRAPSRYYTQNRMVNGEDYSNFPFTRFNSIIKSTAVNRTSIGVSRNQDLADPTGRYGSINSFSDDGATYLNSNDGFTEFTATNTNIVTAFLTSILNEIVNSPGMQQYYQQSTIRYTPTPNTGDGFVYWQTSTVETDVVTGYFYIVPAAGLNVPVSIGASNTNVMQWATSGALIKFQAPSGYYFDSDGHLVAGSSSGKPTTQWNTVNLVIGDGSNGGLGAFSNGTGPVYLSGYLPSGVQVISIIPVFTNLIPNDVIQQCIQLIELETSFTLIYDSTLPPSATRWSIGAANASNYMIKFVSTGDLRYSVQYRKLEYFFGSVRDTRFIFQGDQPVYDPLSGKIQRDFVEVLQSNTEPGSASNLGENYRLTTVGQPTAADGYNNDYEIAVSSLNQTNTLTFQDPDWFTTITGYLFSTNPIPVISTLSTGQITAITTDTLRINAAVTFSGSLDPSLIAGTVYYVKTIDSTTAFTVSLTPGGPTLFLTGGSYNMTVNRVVNNAGIYTFFRQVQDAANLSQYELLPPNAVISLYATLAALESVKYEYPVGTVFYAFSTGEYYVTRQNPASTVQDYTLNLQPVGAFQMSPGRGNLYFQYRHNSGATTRVDPGTTNIIDLYLVTNSYYIAYQNWLQDTSGRIVKPLAPSIAELSAQYSSTLSQYKMLSDTVIYNSVGFKPLFGVKSDPELQGSIKVIKNPVTNASDNEIKSAVVSTLNDYFNINNWDFGATFYGSEMCAYVHAQLGELISSVVIVPADPNLVFGDLYEIRARPYEIFMNGATPTDVIVITANTPRALKFS